MKGGDKRCFHRVVQFRGASDLYLAGLTNSARRARRPKLRRMPDLLER